MAVITQFIRERLQSVGYALKGISVLFVTQPNARVHAFAIIVITSLGLWLGLSTTEWCLILLCMALVLLAEGLNTSLEFLVDLVSPEPHPLAGKTKDVAAGSVLLAVIFGGIIWGIIFIPKFIAWWSASPSLS